MLLALKEDKTTGSFCLCCLLCVLSVIIKSGAVFTNVHLYTIIICTGCTGSMVVYMHPCMLLVTCASKLHINIILLFMFHNITTSSFLLYCNHMTFMG